MTLPEFVKSRLFWIFTSLVFFALPLLIIVYGLGTRWRAQVRHEIEENSFRLRDILLELREQEVTPVYLKNLFVKSFKVMKDSPKPLSILKARIPVLHRRFPGTFRFTVVNGIGRIVSSLTDGKPDPIAVFLYYEYLKEFVLKRAPTRLRKALLNGRWDGIKDFLGDLSTVEEYYDLDSDFFEVRNGDNDNWLIYGVSTNYGCFVHASRRNNWDDLALKDLCHRFSRAHRKKSLSARFTNLQSEDAGTLPELPAIELFRKSSHWNVCWNNRQYYFMEIRPNSFLYVSMPFRKLNLVNRRLVFASFLVTLIFGFLTTFSHSVIIGKRSFSLSIRKRLLVLFLFAGGFPVIVLLMASWDYLEEKIQARTHETFAQMEGILQSLENDWVFFKGRVQTTLTEVLKTIDFVSPEGKEESKKKLIRLRNQFGFFDVYLYDRKGHLLWRGKEAKDQAEDEIGKLIDNVLATINNDNRGNKLDPISLIMESMGVSFNPIKAIVKNQNRVFHFSLLGGKNLWTVFGSIFGPGGKAEFMFRAHWKKTGLDETLVKKLLPPKKRLYPDTDFKYYNFDYDFPSSSKLSKPIRRFFEYLRINQTTTNGRIWLNGERHFIMGTKMKEIIGAYILVTRPERLIQSEIKSLRQTLWIFTSGILVIIGFLGYLLAQRFLEPISNLFLGVKALQKRDFGFRIAEMEPDEFGILGETFNQVMVGMADLDVGRIVQESLFPKGVLTFADFRIYGTSTSATDLGGDYYDYQLLPDGKALFVIGDVSGHGLPAALVMAMARAIMERECMIDSNPELILNNLHRIILKTMKRKRMMTCLCGIADPDKNTILYANAGHSFPYVFSSQEPQVLEGGGLPLGAMKKLTLATKLVELKPGEKLFLYTDGLVEAQVAGEVLGYERMSEQISRFVSDDPQESCEKIVKWHGEITSHRPQDDDITMVLITRAT